MSTSASIIVFEARHLPLVIYANYDGWLAGYSERDRSVGGMGMALLDLIADCEKKKLPPGAERLANEILLMSAGNCTVADCLHQDVEYIYTLEVRYSVNVMKNMYRFYAYKVAPWHFSSDLQHAFWNINSWLSDQIPSTFYERKFFRADINKAVKNALSGGKNEV
ncbi:MAG: hypothetical protein IJ228_01150 [Succinivibrio sp.]|nr:hypothetical protein [Succinivibrio sp.]